jgi:glycine cleavage system regulatory protein
MVQFDVAKRHAMALTTALRGLEASGLRVVIAQSDSPLASPGYRDVSLVLNAPDRPGIVQDLSAGLSAHGISIKELATRLAEGSTPTASHQFKVDAKLSVPESSPIDTLRTLLDSLAASLTADIALDSHETNIAA